MILQALVEYYDRKAKDPDSGIAEEGWEWKEIPYVVILDRDGEPVDIKCELEGTGKKKTGKKRRVPQTVKRSSDVASNLLWDNLEYVTGIPVKEKKGGDEKKQAEKCLQKHEAFRAKIEELIKTTARPDPLWANEEQNGPNVDDPGLLAVLRFTEIPLEEKIEKLARFEAWKELSVNAAANVAFQLVGEVKLVTESPVVCGLIDKFNQRSNEGAEKQTCLVTGEASEIDNLHPSIKGVVGGNPTGTSIVSFNLAPFCSFGKKQGANAPVGKTAVFKYTTALNTMLGKDSENSLRIGGTTTVAWSEKGSPLEKQFKTSFQEPPKDDPDRNVKSVRELFDSIHHGSYTRSDAKDRFYVLGLSPNSARLAVRFWSASTVAEMALNIKRFFDDTEIVRRFPKKEPERLSLFRLLVAAAVQGDSKNIPPNLEGELMRAILTGSPYPRSFLAALVRRARAENEVTYPRAAALKACLNRLDMYNTNVDRPQEIKVVLDKENMSVGYRLGRLFATLEKIQAEANPGLNATIRDRFYGAASGTPVVVFPNLMRLKNHHLSKLSAGRSIYFERLLTEILSSIEDFPRNLSMTEQGRFALGYYHQRQEFFTKKEEESVDDDQASVEDPETKA